MSGIQIVNALPVDNWRRFVEEHPAGSIFHTPEMFQVFYCTKGYQPELWAATDNQQILALLLPVKITLFNGLLRRFSTRSVVLGGLLFAPCDEGRTGLDLLLHTYAQEAKGKSLFTEIRNLTSVVEEEPILRQNGFFHEEHLNFLIDLNQSEEDLFRNISKSGRKAIKKAISKEVSLQELQEQSIIYKYYGLIRRTYQRASIPLADISLFEAVYGILVPKGMAKMCLALYDGEYVAASLELPYKDIIYSWFSGYDKAYRSVYPNDFLVWKIIEWGARNGFHCFDFGGAGHPEEAYGPREFKAKFGGNLVNFGRNIGIHAPTIFRMSRFAYRTYRKIMRYFPAPKTALLQK